MKNGHFDEALPWLEILLDGANLFRRRAAHAPACEVGRKRHRRAFG
jgi:hypothetical protein